MADLISYCEDIIYFQIDPIVTVSLPSYLGSSSHIDLQKVIDRYMHACLLALEFPCGIWKRGGGGSKGEW